MLFDYQLLLTTMLLPWIGMYYIRLTFSMYYSMTYFWYVQYIRLTLSMTDMRLAQDPPLYTYLLSSKQCVTDGFEEWVKVVTPTWCLPL